MLTALMQTALMPTVLMPTALMPKALMPEALMPRAPMLEALPTCAWPGSLPVQRLSILCFTTDPLRVPAGRVLQGMAPVLCRECRAGLNALALKGLFTVLTAVAVSYPVAPPPWEGSKPPANDQQRDWEKQRPQHHRDFANYLWETVQDKEGLTSYTLQSYPPGAWKQSQAAHTAAEDSRIQADAAVRLKPVVELLVACPDTVREYVRTLSDQLMPVEEPVPYEQDLLSEHAPGELAYSPPRGPVGGPFNLLPTSSHTRSPPYPPECSPCSCAQRLSCICKHVLSSSALDIHLVWPLCPVANSQGMSEGQQRLLCLGSSLLPA